VSGSPLSIGNVILSTRSTSRAPLRTGTGGRCTCFQIRWVGIGLVAGSRFVNGATRSLLWVWRWVESRSACRCGHQAHPGQRPCSAQMGKQLSGSGVQSRLLVVFNPPVWDKPSTNSVPTIHRVRATPKLVRSETHSYRRRARINRDWNVENIDPNERAWTPPLLSRPKILRRQNSALYPDLSETYRDCRCDILFQASIPSPCRHRYG
jgi:hypothetical protein